MDFLTLFNILEKNLKLENISLKNDTGVSWRSETPVDVTVNDKVLTDLNRVCLRTMNSDVFVYFNYKTRWEYLKYNLRDLTSIIFE